MTQTARYQTPSPLKYEALWKQQLGYNVVLRNALQRMWEELQHMQAYLVNTTQIPQFGAERKRILSQHETNRLLDAIEHLPEGLKRMILRNRKKDPEVVCPTKVQNYYKKKIVDDLKKANESD